MSGIDQAVARLDAAPAAEAEALLLRCAGSTAWARRMGAARPFGSFHALLSCAEAEWARLSPADVLEAIASHPRIGADLEALRKKYGDGSFSEREQAGVAGTTETVLEALRDANLAYERRFGHIFIVCASGKSAGEILELVNVRLSAEPAAELEAARGELWKITRLRLEGS